MAARAAEKRKHSENDAKCKQTVKLAVHSLSGGNIQRSEAIEVFSTTWLLHGPMLEVFG